MFHSGRIFPRCLIKKVLKRFSLPLHLLVWWCCGASLIAAQPSGTVVAWGDNAFGRATVPPSAQSGVIAVSAGWGHTLALKSNGVVLAWGRTNEGQTTVPLAAQSGVIAITAGYTYSVALKSDGSVVAWGDNCCG